MGVKSEALNVGSQGPRVVVATRRMEHLSQLRRGCTRTVRYNRILTLTEVALKGRIYCERYYMIYSAGYL